MYPDRVGRVLLDQVGDLVLAGHGHAEEVFGKAAHIVVVLFARLPEGVANLVGRVFAHVELKEHLHGKLTRLAAFTRRTGARTTHAFTDPALAATLRC